MKSNFKRKITSQLIEWKNNTERKPLVIRGQRQVGKTFIVKEFGKAHYENVVYCDFRQDKNLRKMFDGSYYIDDIILQLTVNIKGAKVVPYKTLIIFDEVQDCPNARASLKYFCEDGRYDVICTGSLLGIKGYNKTNVIDIPVGYEEFLYMTAMDFEEFLWAEEVPTEVVDICKKSIEKGIEIPLAIHEKMKDLFLKYICVGGMPEVVSKYVSTRNMNTVIKCQREILTSYKDDFGKHLLYENDICVNQTELATILSVFNSIPNQLAKENKKFQFSKIVSAKRKTNDDYKNAIEWLYDAGIVNICNRLVRMELPLEGQKDEECFKIYMSDTGLFVSMLEDGTQADIMKGNLKMYKGAIYENIIADAFTKCEKKLYYYHKSSGLEIDFVTRYDDKCVPIEVKATNGKAKSLKTVLENYETYGLDYAIKFRDGNIKKEEKTMFLPHYLASFLYK